MRNFQIISVLLVVLLLSGAKMNEEVKRPKCWGIVKMTFLVSDFEVARSYYGEFLGFSEVFSYSDSDRELLSFKVNDRQFLEFIEDTDVKEKQPLASLTFECENVNQMYDYAKSKNLNIVKPPSIDGAGNFSMSITDPQNYVIEFMELNTDGLHKKTKGKYLGEHRISKRIHHAGLSISNEKSANEFYKDIFGFRNMWRKSPEMDITPNFIYLLMPDCVENIEFIIQGENQWRNSHPCFLVEDMQDAIYTLKERAGDKYQLARPIIGSGKRWLLNIKNEDGTRVEFTERGTVL